VKVSEADSPLYHVNSDTSYIQYHYAGVHQTVMLYSGTRWGIDKGKDEREPCWFVEDQLETYRMVTILTRCLQSLGTNPLHWTLYRQIKILTIDLRFVKDLSLGITFTELSSLTCTILPDGEVDTLRYCAIGFPFSTVGRVRSAGNVTVITRNLPRNLRWGKNEKLLVIYAYF